MADYMRSTAFPFLLLLGGSFNPPHAGHLRMAIEAAEVLRPARTLFVPCAEPPHKDGTYLLPFALRCELLRAAIRDMVDTPDQERFTVSEMERERNGPSYTIDTLAGLGERFPGFCPAFVMGSEDYARLDTWRNWQDLPLHADLVVLPRSADGLDCFNRATPAFWPDARAIAPPLPGVRSAFALPHGGRLLYLPQPVLEISASLVRARYHERRSLDFLAPPGVARLLREHAPCVAKAWRK